MGQALRRSKNFFTAVVDANTNILASNLTPNPGASKFRVTVACSAGAVFNVTATDATSTGTWGIQKSEALQAKDLYEFEFAVDRDLAYNFQVETSSGIQQLLVDEIWET